MSNGSIPFFTSSDTNDVPLMEYHPAYCLARQIDNKKKSGDCPLTNIYFNIGLLRFYKPTIESISKHSTCKKPKWYQSTKKYQNNNCYENIITNIMEFPSWKSSLFDMWVACPRWTQIGNRITTGQSLNELGTNLYLLNGKMSKFI